MRDVVVFLLAIVLSPVWIASLLVNLVRHAVMLGWIVADNLVDWMLE